MLYKRFRDLVDRVKALEGGGGGGSTPATSVTVAEDTDSGITAGDLQATLVALATRVKDLEDNS